MAAPNTNAMKALTARYLQSLQACSDDIEVFHDACKKGAVDDALRGIMHRHAHSLKGSGLTYGFPDISDTASAVEEQIEVESAPALLVQSVAQLLAAMRAAIATKQEEKSENPVAPPAAKKPILLVVDDDPAIRDLIEELFKRDTRTLLAADGKEALQLMEEYRPDLVIMDDNMPIMTGMEVLEAMRLKPLLASTPVILLTANSDPKNIMRGVMTGALDYIVKPFDTQQLAQKVRDRLQRQSYLVLLADDDPSIRALLEHKFRVAGCQVVLAEDGEQALHLAQTVRPNLLILDRMMPGLDGVAVLQSLRENEQMRDLPVLFLTARRQEQDILEGFRLGAADYVVKPFRPEELLARCFRLLDRPEQR